MEPQKRALTREEAEWFLIIKELPKDTTEKLFEKLLEQPGGWVLKAIEKRFNAYELKVSKKVMMMILMHGEGIVGKCAQYVDDIAKWAKEHDKKAIDITTLAHEIYPWVIPVF